MIKTENNENRTRIPHDIKPTTKKREYKENCSTFLKVRIYKKNLEVRSTHLLYTMKQNSDLIVDTHTHTRTAAEKLKVSISTHGRLNML